MGNRVVGNGNCVFFWGEIIFITCILSWLRTICISNRLPLTAFIIAYNAFLTLNNEQNRTVCVCVALFYYFPVLSPDAAFMPRLLLNRRLAANAKSLNRHTFFFLLL